MKLFDLQAALNAPDAEILVNYDSRLGETAVVSLNDIIALDYISSLDELLEYNIRHIDDRDD